jgi:ribosomal protein S18 acetylase RimI-like enzyme
VSTDHGQLSTDVPGAVDVSGAVDVRLGVADAGELLTLQRAAYVTEAQLHDDLRIPPLTQSLTELCEALGTVTAFGLRLAGRLVAAGQLRVLGPGEVELGRLAVVPDLQGHGLGTRLLRRAEQVAPAGTRRIALFTGEHSTANLRLYRRMGYQETGRTPVPYLPVYDLIRLAKDLG